MSKILSHRGALCNMVRRIAVEAGGVIMPYHDDPQAQQITSKEDGSPVTMADREAEALITLRLKGISAEIPVIGEESAYPAPDVSQERFIWLVDPVDGTREFIKGGEDFTVNIALVENGLPVLGVVYAPAKNEMYAGYTEEDGTPRAFRIIEETGREKDMKVRRPPAAGLTVMSSHRNVQGGKMEAFLSGFKVEKTVHRASSLKICAIAAGKADLYPRFGPTGEWDTAAGDAILRAAGGAIKSLETHKNLVYGQKPGDFRNPHFVAASADVF